MLLGVFFKSHVDSLFLLYHLLRYRFTQKNSSHHDLVWVVRNNKLSEMDTLHNLTDIRHVAMEYPSVLVVFGDFKGMCETLNDKNVSTEETCFSIRSEIAAVSSRVLSY